MVPTAVPLPVIVEPVTVFALLFARLVGPPALLENVADSVLSTSYKAKPTLLTLPPGWPEKSMVIVVEAPESVKMSAFCAVGRPPV